VFAGAHRGEDDEEQKGERYLDEYVRVVEKQNELFSTFDADTIYNTLKELAENKALTF
jgi:hypothetical protein